MLLFLLQTDHLLSSKLIKLSSLIFHGHRAILSTSVMRITIITTMRNYEENDMHKQKKENKSKS